MRTFMEEYRRWLDSPALSENEWAELNAIAEDEKEIQYTVTEAQVPGYKTPVVKKVSANEWAYTITNSITEVTVSKRDITKGDEELAGATLQILDKDGKVVKEWVSGDKPKVIEGLKTGEEYTLRETLAPDGYLITSDTVFTCSASMRPAR